MAQEHLHTPRSDVDYTTVTCSEHFAERYFVKEVHLHIISPDL